jgi:hypothetical protein
MKLLDYRIFVAGEFWTIRITHVSEYENQKTSDFMNNLESRCPNRTMRQLIKWIVPLSMWSLASDQMNDH